MVIEGEYLTYDEYSVLGGNLDQTPFSLFEYNARRMIDERTFNRLIDEENKPEILKYCMFELINLLYSINNGVEIGENAINYNQEDIDKQVDAIVRRYFLGVISSKNVPYLYCGV